MRASSGTKSGRRRTAGVVTLPLVCLLLCSAGGRLAKAQGSGAETVLAPGEAQFVFVLDDSRSMSEESTDPDRLAIFAVRALVGALDPRDWATVVRLNGPRDGERPLDLEPLTQDHRERLLRYLRPEGGLAQYSGDNTPCRSALMAVRELLERAATPRVSQVVIFLSDGGCTPQGEEQVAAALGALAENDRVARSLQVYFLRFHGQDSSPELEQLARATSGATSEVYRGDPTNILSTFAQALTRSQGYESTILSPSRPDLPSHQGARRVRLLGLARGGGEALRIEVRDGRGSALPVNVLDQGTHFFPPAGQKYRWVTADYRPTRLPVRVEVLGAGSGWDVVALPEYRLSVETTLQQAACGGEGAILETGAVAAGTDLCAVVRLVNDRRQVVGQDVTAGDVGGFVEVDAGAGQPRRIVASPSSPTETTFELDLQNVEPGHITLRGGVRLTPPGGQPPLDLPSLPRTLQVVDRSIQLSPTRIDLGRLRPGKKGERTVRLDGGFVEAESRVTLADPQATGLCLELGFAERPLGEELRLRPNQDYFLTFGMTPGCADETVHQLSTRLLFSLQTDGAEQTFALPLEGILDGSSRTAERLVLEIDAGSKEALEIRPPEITAVERFQAWVDPPTTREKEAANELKLRLAGEAAPEAPAEFQVEMGAGRGPTLEVVALPCCDAGPFETSLRLRPVEGGQSWKVPIEVKVRPSWWTCYRSWILGGGLALLVGLLLFYVLSMVTHTVPINRRHLAARLVPLHLPPYGSTPQPAQDRSTDREQVEDIVDRGLRWYRRVFHWFRANPLVFGLPGKRYRETVELHLGSEFDFTHVELVPGRDAVGRLQRSAEIDEAEEGRLFACGGKPARFLAVVGPRQEVRDFRLEGRTGKNDTPRVEPMVKGQRLTKTNPGRDRSEGLVAGWMLD